MPSLALDFGLHAEMTVIKKDVESSHRNVKQEKKVNLLLVSLVFFIQKKNTPVEDSLQSLVFTEFNVFQVISCDT